MTIRNDATRQRIRTRELRSFRGVVSRQGQVLLDTDFEDLASHTLKRVETADADVIGTSGRLAVPALASGFAVSAVSLAGGKIDFQVSDGRGYLDGWLVENPADFLLSSATGANAQPHPWSRPSSTAPAIVGLKAVVRLIDPVEDPQLADRALGDAQASGRSLVDWQVFTLPVAVAAPLLCADVAGLAAWQDIVRPSTGKLQFIKTAPSASDDPCSLVESGGYTRLENLLYRVEVHGGELASGAPDVAVDGPRYKLDKLQLKLSRCNGSVLTRITKVAGKVFTISPSALDPRNWFVEGQLAELVSIHDDVDTSAAHATERLFRIKRVGEDEVELVDRSASATVAQVNAVADGTWFLRLWESLPDGSEVAAVTLDGSGTKSTVVSLGDGISIQLSGDAMARFRRGDFWTCAMRADGEIEWPAGEFETPLGPERRYAPLAAINAGPALEDCRISIASLADRTLLYRGGDGQEAKPDPTKATQRVPLASPLRVAVMRGEHPVAGATVRFEVTDLPSGKTAQLTWQPASGPAQSGISLAVVTDADGRAEVDWEIDPTVSSQFVRAQLVVPAGTAEQPPITFTANLSQAVDTGFDPKAIAVFAGITDVQRALEALAAMQQAGCATYVLSPDNWLTVLKNLKKGENAKLCFQRGRFETDEKVVLAELGHIAMCGAGDATEIVVAKGECAIEFNGCSSVHISDVAMAAPDGMAKGQRGPVVARRGGTVAVLDCPEVHIVDCSFSCGGQAFPERTCITVRGNEKAALRSVRIVDNRLSVGFRQDGILVTDAERCVVDGNEIRAAELPADLDRTRLMLSGDFQKLLLRAMVPEGPIAPARAEVGTPNLRLVRVGRSGALFESPIPQEEWDKIASALPADRGLINSGDVTAYVERLFAVAATNADLIRKYVGDLRRIERVARAGLDAETRAALLRTGEIEVLPLRDAQRRLASAGRTRSEVVPQFPSVMTETDWLHLLRLKPLASDLTADETGEHLRKLARVALADAKLRAGLSSLQKWFEGQRQSLVGCARQAITCGGRTLGDVVVTRNVLVGFSQAVHVGTSFRAALAVIASARSVTIHSNVGQLETLGDTMYSPSGIFVGNADHVRIADNRLGPAREFGAMNVGNAIRLWGHFGRFIAIEKNALAVGHVAINIRSLRPISDADARGLMWLVADNLGEAHAPAAVLKAPSFVERRYNRP